MPYEIAGALLVLYLGYLGVDSLRRERNRVATELEQIRTQLDQKIDELIVRYDQEPYEIFRRESLIPYEKSLLLQKLESLSLRTGQEEA